MLISVLPLQAATTIGTNISTDGALTITATGSFQLQPGASVGFVLSSDGTGNASWTNLSGLETDPIYSAWLTANPNIDLDSTDDFNPSTLAVDYGFTDNSANWDTAFGWGNHAGLYIPIGASFGGDVTGTYGASVVGDDTHNHTGTTISGLTTADFTSANVSQWTNDSSYITSAALGPWNSKSYPADASGYLSNDGAGNLTWTTPTASVAWGGITGTLSNQTDLNTALSGKEPTITGGAVSTYWRGDKSWQTLNQAAVAGLTTSDNPTFTGLTLSGLTNGLLKADGSGVLSVATAGTDYENPLNFSSPLSRSVNTIGITNDSIGNTQLAFDTGQNLTTVSSPTFAGLTLTGFSGVVKASAGVLSAGSVNLASEVSGNLPVGNLNSGTGANGTTFWRGDGTWATPGGSGTVTSVAASGGTTGLTFSGSPITTSGTLTLGGTLNITNGGTGATTANGARNNLSLGTGDSPTFAGLTITSGGIDLQSVLYNSTGLVIINDDLEVNGTISHPNDTVLVINDDLQINGNGVIKSGSSVLTVDDDLDVLGDTILNGVTYTWPGSDGSTGNVLTTNGTGVLSWQPAGGLTGTTNDSTLRYNSGTSSWVENTNFKVGTSGKMTLPTGTIADGGTSNTPVGRVTATDGNTTITVNNNLVTASSHIFVTPETNNNVGNNQDEWYYVTPGAGAFTITGLTNFPNPTTFSWFVIN